MKLALVAIPSLVICALIAAKFSARHDPSTSNPANTDAKRPSPTAVGVAVTVARVTRGEMMETLDLTGVLRAAHEVHIGTKLPARALRVLVKEGDRVGIGQRLVQLDDRDYAGQVKQAEAAVKQAEAGQRAAEAMAAKAKQGVPLKATEARAQIAQAEENVRAAESQLRAAELGANLEARQADSDVDKAQSGLRSAEAGLAKAKKGARPEEVTRAESGARQAEEGLKKMQRDFDAAKKLYDAGGLTKRDLEDAQTGLKVAAEQLNDARAALRLARAGATAEDLALADEEVKRAKSSYDLAKSTVEDRKRVAHERAEAARTQVTLAKKQLELARAGKAQVALGEEDLRAAVAAADQARAGVQQARASLALAQQQVQEARIIAPVAGVVSNLSVHAGEMLLPGAILMTITSQSGVLMEASLSLRDRARVKVGQEVALAVDASEEKFAGHVAEIGTVAGNDNRSFKVRIAIADRSPALTPGAAARGTITLRIIPDALLIPREALLDVEEFETNHGRERKARVFVVIDGRAIARAVYLLDVTSDNLAGAYHGMEPGDRVITAGAAMLKSGDRVTARQDAK